MTVYVYGASDDLIEIEGDLIEEFNIEDNDVLNYRAPYHLGFSDGTLLKITYDGEWNIKLLAGRGIIFPTHARELSKVAMHNFPEGVPDYSDLMALNGDITWVVGGTDVIKWPVTMRMNDIHPKS